MQCRLLTIWMVLFVVVSSCGGETSTFEELDGDNDILIGDSSAEDTNSSLSDTGEAVTTDDVVETDVVDTEVETDSGPAEDTYEEQPLPPSLSYFYGRQLDAFDARRVECGLGSDTAIPDGVVEHVTTRMEYQRHLSCLADVGALGCGSSLLADGDLALLGNCLFADPTIYDARNHDDDCSYIIDEFTFDHRRQKFSLNNAYWLMWMADACNLVEPELIEKRFASMGFDKAKIYEMDRLTVAVLEEEEYIVFSFKGSTGMADYLSNANFFMLDKSKTGIPGRVHGGFYGTFKSGWTELKIELLAAKETGKTIIFTGHSLGAACSQMAAYKANALGVEIAQIYNYAAPRLGNQAYADAFEEVFGDRFYRINNGLDSSPHVPPSGPAESVAKKSILGLLKNDPAFVVASIRAILEFALNLADFTHAGDEYMFDPTGYFLELRPYKDTDDIPYWENFGELFEGENFLEVVFELDMMPEYHDDALQLCYHARAIHELIYDWK